MKQRRRIRRSSPDAPQGFVPVLTVFAGLIAVVVFTGVGFIGSGGDSSSGASKDSVAARNGADGPGATTVVPTTALIRGGTTTTLFVTTTTPITTTTSTTSTSTTTLPGPALEAGAEVTFAPGQVTAVFTVNTTDPAGLEFNVTGVPGGMTATPNHATVVPGSPVQITLKITDPDQAQSGTIILVGSDGTRVPVRVTIQAPAFALTSVAFDPDPPVCGNAANVVAEVAGPDVESVSANITIGGARSTLTMNGNGSGTWTAALPSARAGTSVSATVVATSTDGKTAARTLSTQVADGPDCPA